MIKLKKKGSTILFYRISIKIKIIGKYQDIEIFVSINILLFFWEMIVFASPTSKDLFFNLLRVDSVTQGSPFVLWTSSPEISDPAAVDHTTKAFVMMSAYLLFWRISRNFSYFNSFLHVLAIIILFCWLQSHSSHKTSLDFDYLLNLSMHDSPLTLLMVNMLVIMI